MINYKTLQRAIEIAKRHTAQISRLPESWDGFNATNREMIQRAKNNPAGYWMLTNTDASKLFYGITPNNATWEDRTVKRVYCIKFYWHWDDYNQLRFFVIPSVID